jgi:hypothetical protein
MVPLDAKERDAMGKHRLEWPHDCALETSEGTPEKPPSFVLDIRASRRIIWQASLIMSNLRTKRRENVGWGYTNRAAGCQGA